MALLKISKEQILSTLDLEDGVYDFRARSCKVAEHKSKKGAETLKVSFVFEVVGQDGKKDSPAVGRTMGQDYYMNFLSGFLPLVTAITGETFADPDSLPEEFDLDTDSLIGKEFVGRVVGEPYEGRTIPKLTDVFPAGTDCADMF
jgi:hypothetical protein